MCGIVGYLDSRREGSREDATALLERMSGQIAARGPDEETYYVDDALAVAFRRLSIVDLAGGSQPIWNEDRTKFVVANGEIYNHLELRARLGGRHQYRTRSDSEVLVHLYEEYGPDMLPMLDGIFAFAVWDVREQELFLARDRFGVKPLYYAQTRSALLFGSELRALLEHPDCARMPNFVDWHQPGMSPVAGINILRGGFYAIAKPGAPLAPKQYWSYHSVYMQSRHLPARRVEDYVDEYASLMEGAVHRQLMSDVPIGVFLSGGLDSCIIAALAAKWNKDIRCFHIHDRSDQTGDTAATEALVAAEGLKLTKVSLADRRFLNLTLQDLEYLVWTLGAPGVNAVTLSKLATYGQVRLVEPQMKVVMIGAGADEFAGGYSKDSGDPYGKAHPTWEAFHRSHVNLPQKFAPMFRDDFVPDETHAYAAYLRGQVEASLESWNLWYEDRASSSQSVEARVPFLDHRLVEFLLSIPTSMHKTLFWDKTIERLAADRWLPRGLAQRKKIGFIPARQVGAEQHQGILKVFKQFDEKYLGSPDTVFSPEIIRQLAQRLTAQPNQSPGLTVEDMSLIMQIEIFNRQCRLPREYRTTTWNPVLRSV